MKTRYKILIGVGIVCLVIAIIASIWFFAFELPKIRKQKEIEKAFNEYYNAKVEMYAKQNLEYEDYEIDVTFVGDSLTDCYDLNYFYPEFKVLNRGIGGDTTFGVEKRLQVSLYDLKPKVAVMLIGANNLKNMFDNYENILKGFKENLPQTKIILLSLTSMGKEWSKNNQLAAFNNFKIKKLAEKYGFNFVDLYSPLLNLETNEIYEDYTTDGGHLTLKGYNVVTSVVKPVLEDLLN